MLYRHLTNIIVLAAVLVLAAPAYAQPRTTESTTLWNNPKGKQKAVARLGRGQKVKVIERSGRWVRVRAGKHEGWVRASKISARSRSRSNKGKRAKPAASAPKAAPAAQQAAEIERPEGSGWRGMGAHDAVSADWSSGSAEAVETSAYVEAPEPRERRGRVGLAAGYHGIGMDFRAQSPDGVMDYEAAANALMVSVNGTYSVVPIDWPLLAEVEGEYALSYADSGLHYLSADGAYYEIPFSAHTLRAGAKLGYRMSDRLQVAARLGYQLEATLFQEIDARALLPRERLHGLSAGGRVRFMPGLRSLAVQLGGDFWLMGARTQTGDLEDGTESQVSVWSAHAGLEYRLMSRVDVSLQYFRQSASTEWNGASSRLMGVDHATRDDVNYMIYLGVSRSL